VKQTIEEQVRGITDETNRAYRTLAERVGINLTDLMALYYLYGGDGPATPSALSRHLGLTTGATAILLNRLEAKNFVTRQQHPTDGRGVLLKLNLDATSKAFQIAGREPYQIEDRVLDGFSRDELTVISRFLGAVLDDLKLRESAWEAPE
jgi:DNA-binding MarR family transcriptional regulator